MPVTIGVINAFNETYTALVIDVLRIVSNL